MPEMTRAELGALLDMVVEFLNRYPNEGLELSLWQSSNDPGWKWAYVTGEQS